MCLRRVCKPQLGFRATPETVKNTKSVVLNQLGSADSYFVLSRHAEIPSMGAWRQGGLPRASMLPTALTGQNSNRLFPEGLRTCIAYWSRCSDRYHSGLSRICIRKRRQRFCKSLCCARQASTSVIDQPESSFNTHVGHRNRFQSLVFHTAW